MLLTIVTLVLKQIQNSVQIFSHFLYPYTYLCLVKAHIRKAAALFAMREYSRAQKSYEDVLVLDQNNSEAKEGLRNCYRSSNDEDPEKTREKALQDPEVQEILRDPGMRLLLEQMSQVHYF